MTPPSRVAILGTGLIGASLGLALKRLASAPTVVGFDLDSSHLRAAQRAGSIDRAAADLADAVRDAELVVIATPVRAAEVLLRELGVLLRDGAVVTDTSSTKAQVVQWADRALPRHVGFVGGHPMTGKATANVDGPDGGLFQGTTYCLTPTADTPPEVVERATWLVEAVGAFPYFLDAAEHDELVAAVSHLPYLVSVTLMNDLASDAAWREMSVVAAGGMIAATSLADGDARMFADICLTNREPLVRALDRYLSHLQAIRELVAAGDETIVDRFDLARRRRADWLAQRSPPRLEDPALDVRPSNPFLPARVGSMLRAKRPQR